MALFKRLKIKNTQEFDKWDFGLGFFFKVLNFNNSYASYKKTKNKLFQKTTNFALKNKKIMNFFCQILKFSFKI
jgi:hypothetical protein